MIKENIEKILKELPPGVELAAAVKGRSIAEVKEAAAAGVTILADNYLQEAAEKIEACGRRAIILQMDVTERASVAAAAKVARGFGPISRAFL